MGHRNCNCVECSRGEQFLQDQLARYTDKLCYDCTLSVGTSNPTVVKGHKMALASASDAFARMLYSSDFIEGNKQKDDPIAIKDDISPEAVDYVLRWIYGKVDDFSEMSIVCEAYKFARKWMINDLKIAAEKKIKYAASDEHLPAYETTKYFGNDSERDRHLQFIVLSTNKFLTSPYWLNAEPSTIVDILKLSYLRVKSESDLFEALVRWGEANSESADDLRRIIAEPLKLIWFRTIPTKRFALLCLEHADVFSLEEKCQILTSLTLEDPNLMPDNFALERKLRRRKLFSLNRFGDDYRIISGDVNCDSPSFGFTFRMDSFIPVYVSHVVLDCLSLESNYGREADLICSLTDVSASFKEVGVARFKGIISEDTEQELKFSRPVPIEQGRWYKLYVSYLNQNYLSTKKYYYKPLKEATWSNISRSLKMKFRDLGKCHFDLNRLQFYLC